MIAVETCCAAADHLPCDHPEQVPRVSHKRAGVSQKHWHPVHDEGIFTAAHNEGGGPEAGSHRFGRPLCGLREQYMGLGTAQPLTHTDTCLDAAEMHGFSEQQCSRCCACRR